ncbi:MAG: T9SS type A sorting domain-containing protein [bacterium]
MRALSLSSLIIFIFTLFWILSSEINLRKPEKKALFSEARQALDLMNTIRAYPNKAIPKTGFVASFDFMQKRLPKTATHNFDAETWEPIGPQNIGGRTLAIALNPQNPNTIYAGSASGGLWRSYCGGVGENAWQRIRTGFAVVGVSSIAIAPDDSNTIYIGTGEVYGSDDTFPGIIGDRTTRGSYGIGILKTENGGLTWEKSLDWTLNQRRGVQMLRINPLLSKTVWAATTEGTFKSNDGGQTWGRVFDVPMATDLAINSVDTNTVFLACGGMGSTGHGLYRTENGGANWTKMNLGPGAPATFKGKMRLGMAPSNPDIVYASIGKSSGALFTGETLATWLVKTIDGGDNWTVVSTEDYSRIQGWYAHDVAVHPTNPNIVWTAGQPFSPFRSTSGGTNLTAATSLGLFQPDPETLERDLPSSWADFHHIVYHPEDSNVIYFANDGGVFRTNDAGRTVINCNLGYQTTQFYNGFSNARKDSLFALGGMQDNGTAAYEGDLFWRSVSGGDGGWTAIDQSKDEQIFVSSQFLNIRKHPERGLFGSFVGISPPIDITRTNFIAPYILSPADNRTLYAATHFVFRSRNGGATWVGTNNSSPIDGNPFLTLAGSHQNANRVYGTTSALVTRAQVFRTDDGGQNWFNITGALPDRIPTDIAVDPNTDQNIFITFGGFGSPHVFKSTDAGDNWVDISSGLPDITTWAVTCDPDFPERLFVGNDVGVFRSTDSGLSWEPFMNGLPEAVMAMDLSVSLSNRKLRLATHGNGVYEIRLTSSPATSVADSDPVLPQTHVLHQNFPNPFNLETRIRYFLHQDTGVDLSIYNSLGQRIKYLVNETQKAGWHDALWAGSDDQGRIVATGLYFYQLSTSTGKLSKKMIVIK